MITESCSYGWYHKCRVRAEQRRLEEIGPIAYYSEWVKAWNRDTSREAVQKHFEETGEDENTQLITMFQHQTAEEYRIMMGTDIRIPRDPLAMRMREDQIKESMLFPTYRSLAIPFSFLSLLCFCVCDVCLCVHVCIEFCIVNLGFDSLVILLLQYGVVILFIQL